MPTNALPFAWPDGKRAAVSLTFDDARLSQPDVAIPILNAHSVRATFYVSFGNLESRIEAWRAAVSTGHEIGNHTLTHPCSGNFQFARGNPLETYTTEEMEREIEDANDRIGRLLGVRPETFAYPCGQKYVGRGENTQSYVPLVARHFLAGRGFMDESANDPAWCDLAQLMAVPVDEMHADEAVGWVKRAISEGSWLVFASHEVGRPARQTMLAETLEAVCAFCRTASNGVWIDTVAAIARHVHERQNIGSVGL